MASSQTQDLADRIARGGPGIRQQLKRIINRLLTRHMLAEQLFIDPATGQPSPAAAEWFRRLANENFVNGGGFDADPLRHAYNAGKRDLACEILNSARLDHERLSALKNMEREVE